MDTWPYAAELGCTRRLAPSPPVLRIVGGHVRRRVTVGWRRIDTPAMAAAMSGTTTT